jgi:hypothetical protein
VGCGGAGRRPGSRSTNVHVVEAAQDGPDADRAGGGARCRGGRLEPQGAVETLAVVVVSELGEHYPQVVLVDYQEVIQALPPPGVLFRNIVTGAGLPTSCPPAAAPPRRRVHRGHDVAEHPGVTMSVNHTPSGRSASTTCLSSTSGTCRPCSRSTRPSTTPRGPTAVWHWRRLCSAGRLGRPQAALLAGSSRGPSSAGCTTCTSARRKPDGLPASYSPTSPRPGSWQAAGAQGGVGLGGGDSNDRSAG